MNEASERAQSVVPVFDGDRLLAIRELVAATQAEVANAAGITPSALSQAERGLSKPTAGTLARLAQSLDVPVEAFARRPGPTNDLNPQFRHLRRTPHRERRRALRLVEATAAIVGALATRVRLPEAFSYEEAVDPTAPVEEVAGHIEHIAADVRSALSLSREDPLPVDLIELLENSGVMIVRDPDTDKAIDAYSAIVNDQPIVILDGGSESVWDRDNFNLAHELGHLVMHRGSNHRPGMKTAERQAHRFAGAFFAPETAIRNETPRDLDWGRYLELKIRWGLSIAALVHRAHDLGIIDDPAYTRAMKQRSAYGWRRTEPGNHLRPQPQPSLLARAAEAADLLPDEVAELAGLPITVTQRILGTGPRPTVRV